MPTRRRLLSALALAPALGGLPPLARADMRGQPLTLGIEGILQASGFADRLRKVVAHEIGLVVNLVPGPSNDLLDQLQAGQLHAALTQSPQREAVLDREGLTHSRKLVARTTHVIVGPAADPAGLKGGTDVLQALDRLVAFGQQNGAAAGGWIQQGEPNGTRELESSLWKALGPRPMGTWMRMAPRGPRAALEMAAAQPGGGAYTLVERGLWQATKSPLKLLVEGDARLETPCHIALPFRGHHAAAKLLAGWLAMPGGQRALLPFGPYRPAKG